jgi:hypothetical protein
VHARGRSTRNKSLFASFSSEKEDLFFFEKKNQKTFISRAPPNAISHAPQSGKPRGSNPNTILCLALVSPA